MSVVAGMMQVDRKLLPAIRKDLTFVLRDRIAETETTIQAYTDTGTYLHLPRAYGMSKFAAGYDDCTSLGRKIQAPLQTISLHDHQKPWVDETVRLFREGAYDVVSKAHTGSGKTVMALEIARRLGRAVLVVIDSEFLRDQWIERAADRKFLNIPRDRIGLIQGPTLDYLGKDIVVGMVQTMYRKAYPDELLEYFGTVIFDECHSVSSEQYSRVLGMFPARYRLAVSATMRTDALQRLLDVHLGPVKVTLEREHKPSQVRYVEYGGVLSWYANISPKSGRYLSELADDTTRNLLLAEVVCWLYDQGHDVLVISDRIEQLACILEMCVSRGMPREETGLVAGYGNSWGYVKDPEPTRRPVGWEPGTDYCPVKLEYARVRIPRKELARRKDTAKVIFATYGMFSKGVDVPRLSAGVDCTPRAKAQQVHGRILRPADGKLTPVWVTVRDHQSTKAEYQFGKRLLEYGASNAEIVQWRLQSSQVRRRNPSELSMEIEKNLTQLKRAKIVTEPDGNAIVWTPTTAKLSNERRSKPIARPTQKRLPL